MAQIHQFREIKDFVQSINLNIESRFPDFLMYNYEDVHHENYRQLPAYRQSFFEINFELTEGCSLKVDQFDIPSTANRLTFISPYRLQTVQSHSCYEGQYKGYGLFFKPEFIHSSVANSRFLKEFPFFSPLHSPTLRLSNKEASYFTDILHRIQYEYDHYSTISQAIINHYLNILFLKAKENYLTSTAPSKAISREQEIFHEFEFLVQKYFLELHSVKAYADKIFLSPKHLSETVKKVSGQSALQVIHKAQLNHAKALLLHTSKTVSEIAYELNFENPDYFSVFFKRLTGKSPLQFRIS